MEYSPKELADELGCNVRQIRHALDCGCPQRCTSTGRVWITGDVFATWIGDMEKRRKRRLRDDEVYCLRCGVVRLPDDVTVFAMANGVERLSGPCPKCQATVNRFRKATRQ
jgi:hypothetical protein